MKEGEEESKNDRGCNGGRTREIKTTKEWMDGKKDKKWKGVRQRKKWREMTKVNENKNLKRKNKKDA